MQVNLISVAVNVVLDPVLIFGFGPFPEMGVVGAAVATVFSRALASFIGIHRLFKGGNGVRITLADMKPHSRMIGRIMKIGLPVSLGQLGTSLGFTFMIGIVNSFGSAVTAAFGVGSRIIHMALVPAMGLSQANATAVGQNLGAGNVRRAEKSSNTALLLIGLILLPVTLGMFFFGADISKVFVDDPEVIQLDRTMFRITTPSVFVFGFLMILLGSFQGSGYTMPVMALNMSRLWILRIPGAYLLAYTAGMGPSGIWWAMFVSNTAVTIAGWIWFRRGTWKNTSEEIVFKTETSGTVSSAIGMD
jgi:putative MATE family efflux protein